MQQRKQRRVRRDHVRQDEVRLLLRPYAPHRIRSTTIDYTYYLYLYVPGTTRAMCFPHTLICLQDQPPGPPPGPTSSTWPRTAASSAVSQSLRPTPCPKRVRCLAPLSVLSLAFVPGSAHPLHSFRLAALCSLASLAPPPPSLASSSSQVFRHGVRVLRGLLQRQRRRALRRGRDALSAAVPRRSRGNFADRPRSCG